VRPFLFPPSAGVCFVHYRLSLRQKESAFKEAMGQIA